MTRFAQLIATLVLSATVAGCGAARQAAFPIGAQSETTATAASSPRPVPAQAIERAPEGRRPEHGRHADRTRRRRGTHPGAAHATLNGSDDITAAGRGDATYLITFRGTFIGYAVSRPSGAAPPHGQYFSVGIDAADLSVSGLAITQTREPTGA